MTVPGDRPETPARPSASRGSAGPYDLIWDELATIRRIPVGTLLLAGGFVAMAIGIVLIGASPADPRSSRDYRERDSGLAMGNALLTGGGFTLVGGAILVAGGRRKD